jgi:hypothetical protein
MANPTLGRRVPFRWANLTTAQQNALDAGDPRSLCKERFFPQHDDETAAAVEADATGISFTVTTATAEVAGVER